MMLDFLETGNALYVLAAACFLGLAGRLTARNIYKRMMKETDNMTLTKNRYLRDLKQKTENAYRLNQGIRDSRVYLEKQLSTYRFLGITLSGWGSFGGQMTVLCFLLGGAAAFGAYWYRCDSYYIVLYGSMGILAGLVTMVADYWANLGEGKQQLLNSLQDYMENSLFNRLARETASAAVEEGRRDNVRERAGERRNRLDSPARSMAGQTANGEEAKKNPSGVLDRKEEDDDDMDFAPQDLETVGRGQRRGSRMDRRAKENDGPKEGDKSRRDVDYLKTSLEQIAASRERNRMDGDWVKDMSQDELELVGQILRQYLT